MDELVFFEDATGETNELVVIAFYTPWICRCVVRELHKASV
jgi:hypothetical protein